MMKKYEFTFESPDDNDDFLEVRLNGELVVELNHDEDGWAGMDRVKAVCEEIERMINKAT
jgi:hypothetical protein